MAKIGITSTRGSFAPSTGDVPGSRRALRKLEKKQSRGRASRYIDAAVVAQRSRRWGTITVMSVAFALVGTLGLPAYADNPATRDYAPVVDLAALNGDSQTLVGTGSTTANGRDKVRAATTIESLRAGMNNGWSGPTVDDFMKNPPNPHFSLAAVYREALKYQGVPYVYGGSTPSGFDCSGFTRYVYASFGILLPHSAHLQLSMGTPIAEKDAHPGDLVWMEGHVGIWAGPGMMVDAPTEGRSVSLEKIYTSNYVVFRVGI